MSSLRTFALGLMAIAANLLASPLQAEERFPPASPEIIVWSARACYAEATWSVADCSALLHVIRKRASKSQWPFLKMLKRYSVNNWLKGTSGRRTGALSLASNQNQTERWNESWQQLVRHVIAVFSDSVSDPCPRADHWAAASHTPRSPMRRVRCTQKVENAFWVSVPG